jgi:hypothetical protein
LVGADDGCAAGWTTADRGEASVDAPDLFLSPEPENAPKMKSRKRIAPNPPPADEEPDDDEKEDEDVEDEALRPNKATSIGELNGPPSIGPANGCGINPPVIWLALA